jgi:hypothetical protein
MRKPAVRSVLPPTWSRKQDHLFYRQQLMSVAHADKNCWAGLTSRLKEIRGGKIIEFMLNL